MIRQARIHDLDKINVWREQRGLSKWDGLDMPKYGIIVPGVAACFLLKTDTRYAFLEGLIANRDVSAGIRHEALNMCIEACIEKAKKLGFEQLVFLTDHHSVMRYGDAFGFKFVKLYNFYERGI